jgi:hypothetical protein
MFRSILAGVLTVLVIAQPEDKPAAASRPVESQPTTRPTGTSGTLRKPVQAEMLKKLLAQKDRPVPIQPQTDPAHARPGPGPDGRTLLLEGTSLTERPGRLVREGGRAKFVFHLDGESQAPRSMPILESQLLEMMEKEAEAGFQEFIVSGEVTRYRGTNYLLVRKVLRRTGEDNLSP